MFMLVLFYSYVLAYRLQNLRKPERPQNIVGRAGRVYINVGDGRYTVFVKRDGAERELDVVSESGRTDYKTDQVVTIKEYRDNKYYIECVYNEVQLTLTPIEFDILWLLCENRGKVISSEELFEKVWHEKYYKNSNNTVMVHIRHLREKMSAPTGKSDFIKTVWGVGYKVEE